jgi:hypothetical protein
LRAEQPVFRPSSITKPLATWDLRFAGVNGFCGKAVFLGKQKGQKDAKRTKRESFCYFCYFLPFLIPKKDCKSESHKIRQGQQISNPLLRSATDVLAEADLLAALRTAAQGPDRAGDGGVDALSPADAGAGKDREWDEAG